MLDTKVKINKVMSIFSLAIAIWSLGSLVAIAQSQTNDSNNTINSGLPDNRQAGGSRELSCIAQDDNFTVLIPNKTVNTTASIDPKIFFYVPKTTEQKTIEFVLRDHKDQLIHEAFLKTDGQAGIMNVEIPQDISKSLEQSNSNYKWYLSMICDSQNRSRDLVLEGQIGYVELDNSIRQQLENSSPAEQAKLYLKAAIWFDALSVVAKESHQMINTESTQKWAQMLEDIGLAQLSTQPFIDSQVIEK